MDDQVVRKPTDDPWLGINDAARMLGIARQTVLVRALRGELEIQVFGGRQLVSRASVERALAGSA